MIHYFCRAFCNEREFVVTTSPQCMCLCVRSCVHVSVRPDIFGPELLYVWREGLQDERGVVSKVKAVVCEIKEVVRKTKEVICERKEDICKTKGDGVFKAKLKVIGLQNESGDQQGKRRSLQDDRVGLQEERRGMQNKKLDLQDERSGGMRDKKSSLQEEGVFEREVYKTKGDEGEVYKTKGDEGEVYKTKGDERKELSLR